MSKRRPTISDGMKYRALKLHERVMVQCFTCERIRASFVKMLGAAPPGLPLWHSLDEIEFDHIHELADGGKHGAKHLRPMCIEHHKAKTKRNEKLRHHLDRAGKKHRGEHKSKHPMPNSGRKLQSRPFPKRSEIHGAR